MVVIDASTKVGLCTPTICDVVLCFTFKIANTIDKTKREEKMLAKHFIGMCILNISSSKT